MTAAAPAWPASDYRRLPIPAAAIEVLAYLTVIAAATLAFLAGWLPVNGAVVLTVALLGWLIAASWVNLGQGRHPVFLFLCSLMLFQGGRLIAYFLGAEPEPLRVIIMTPLPFNLSRDEAGVLLLALTLAAVCVYAPCRMAYRLVTPPPAADVQKYLPYLYLLFIATLPVQLFKNFRYYEYVQQHGGYVFIYVNHGAIAASVPIWVRGISLITIPVFVAIFVFERRRLPLYVTTALYFATASIILLLGARGALFTLVAVLWWIARIKATRKSRMSSVVLFALALLFVGFVIQKVREDEPSGYHEFSAVDVVKDQGISLNVTEVAIKYADRFRPYFGSYLLQELQLAFVASDAAHYHRGGTFAADVSVLLNPEKFEAGYGTAGSYIGEAYIGGGLMLVVLVSITVGMGLNAIYKFSGNALLLFLFAMSLPDILLMPKGQLLDWVSVFLKTSLSIVLLWFGWKSYSLLLSIRQTPAVDQGVGS
jgi:O-antigen polysaccharide polymerase Wzy